MAEYYLISQLPSLDSVGDTSPLPMTEERFYELCQRFLGKKALRELEKLTVIPPVEPERSGSALIRAWNEGERDLRLVLCKARAERRGRAYELPKRAFPAEHFRVADAAMEAKDPLEAEKLLLRYRLSFLERLRPMDGFSEEYVFYYALKLKLLLRIRRFDTETGEAEYKKIYSSILNGERLEAK